MDRTKAMKLMSEIKLYLTAGNPVWDLEVVAEACDMAIEALRNEINCVKCVHYTERETYTGIKGVCKMDTAHRGDIIYRNEVAVAIDMADGDTKMADRKDVWDLVQGIPSVNCTRILIGSDLISRQDAIDAIRNRVEKSEVGESVDHDQVIADIESLPSEQPKIIRCKDCKHWHREIHNGIEHFNFNWCDLNHYGDGHNFYCADGEREDGEA